MKHDNDDTEFGSYGIRRTRWNDDAYSNSYDEDDLFKRADEKPTPVKRSRWGWGWREEDDKDDKVAEKRSGLSSYWGNRFGGFKSWYADKGDMATYIHALSTVSRLSGIIFNKDIAYTWDANKAAEGAGVALDKEPIDAKPDDWTHEEAIDALVGDALSQGAMVRFGYEERRGGKAREREDNVEVERLMQRAGYTHPMATTHGAAFANGASGKSAEWKERWRHLRATAEWLYSTERVKSDFPGYSGYFDRDRGFRHRDSKRTQVESEVAAAFATNPKSHTGALANVVWNALAPAGTELPALDPKVHAIAQRLREEALAASSHEAAMSAAKRAFTDLLEYKDEGDPQEQPQCSMAHSPGQGDNEGEYGDPEEDRGLERAFADQIEEACRADYKQEDMEYFFLPENTYQGQTVKIASKWEPARPKQYAQVREHVYPLIARVREQLSFRNEIATMNEFGLRSGNVDEFGLERIAYGDTRLFSHQDVISAPSVHLGLLVDESGSMAGEGERVARECAILIAEACRDYHGVHISIWGHTANEDSLSATGPIVRRYIERGHGPYESLGALEARANNCDGLAIAWCGKRMLELSANGSEQESRILFVLSDGQPHGWIADDGKMKPHERRRAAWHMPSGGVTYSGTEHTSQMIRAVRTTGTEVFGLGMGHGIYDSQLSAMYGKGMWMHCEDASALPRALGALLNRALSAGSMSA